MAKQDEKPTVLSYEPARPAGSPPAHHWAKGLLRWLPWLGIYWVMVLCVLMLVMGRIFARRDEPLTWGSVIADLFVAWLLLGLCVTIYRIVRKRK